PPHTAAAVKLIPPAVAPARRSSTPGCPRAPSVRRIPEAPVSLSPRESRQPPAAKAKIRSACRIDTALSARDGLRMKTSALCLLLTVPPLPFSAMASDPAPSSEPAAATAVENLNAAEAAKRLEKAAGSDKGRIVVLDVRTPE